MGLCVAVDDPWVRVGWQLAWLGCRRRRGARKGEEGGRRGSEVGVEEGGWRCSSHGAVKKSEEKSKGNDETKRKKKNEMLTG